MCESGGRPGNELLAVVSKMLPLSGTEPVHFACG